MKKWISATGILLSMLLFPACEKEALTTLDDKSADELCQALIDENLVLIEDIFENLLIYLDPSPANHPDGHKDNLNELVSRLNTSDCLVATNLCYACGLSLPPYSMIGVDIDFEGTQVSKVLLILTPMDDRMSFMSIQE